jgi:hypothetical protein
LIFAFCNIDDFSWGTKGQMGNDGDRKYRDEKILFLVKWMFSNSVFTYILISTYNIIDNKSYMILAIGTYGTAIIFLKFFFGIVHHIKFYTWVQLKKWYFFGVKKYREYKTIGFIVKKSLSPETVEEECRKERENIEKK